LRIASNSYDSIFYSIHVSSCTFGLPLTRPLLSPPPPLSPPPSTPFPSLLSIIFRISCIPFPSLSSLPSSLRPFPPFLPSLPSPPLPLYFFFTVCSKFAFSVPDSHFISLLHILRCKFRALRQWVVWPTAGELLAISTTIGSLLSSVQFSMTTSPMPLNQVLSMTLM